MYVNKQDGSRRRRGGRGVRAEVPKSPEGSEVEVHLQYDGCKTRGREKGTPVIMTHNHTDSFHV